MDAKPGLLQKVIRFRATDKLRQEKTMQLRAHRLNQSRGSVKIAQLILGHEVIEIAFRRHAVVGLAAILMHHTCFVQFLPTLQFAGEIGKVTLP
jgi:hypothetical protein